MTVFDEIRNRFGIGSSVDSFWDRGGAKNLRRLRPDVAATIRALSQFGPLGTPTMVKGSPVAGPSVLRSRRESARNNPGIGISALSSLMQGPDGGAGADSSYQDIIASLRDLQDPSRYMMGEEDLQSQARAAANAQYNPLIRELLNQKETAQTQAGRDKEALKQMFGGLANDLQSDIPDVRRDYKGTRARQEDQYRDLESSIRGEYANSQKEQEEMYKRLGIEAAAGDIMPEQQRDRQYFTNLAKTERQSARDTLKSEEQADVSYTRAGTGIAKMEGTTRQADLMAKLQDVLGAYDSQIGSHRAARESSYTSGLGQLQQQSQEMAYKRAQADFDNYLQSVQLQRALSNDEFNQQLQMQKLQGQGVGTDAVKSLADVPGRAGALGADQGQAQDLYDIFKGVIETSPFIKTRQDPRYPGTTATAEALAARVVEEGRRNGLDSAELNMLQSMALEYFGRR